MQLLVGTMHRGDRMLGFFPNWDSPTLHPQASVSPPLWLRAGDTLADGRGCGGSQFGRGDRHCGTLGIYVLYYVVPCPLCGWYTVRGKGGVYNCTPYSGFIKILRN